MKKIVLFLIFIPYLSFSQINESDTLNFKAKLSVTGLWQGGNVETIIFRASSDISFKAFEKAVFKTRNSYTYQEFGKEKADEDILSLNFLYLNPEKKIYPQLLGFVSTNYRRKIDLRYLFGAGFTFQLYKNKKNLLKLSLTTEYENTHFDQTDFNKDDYDGSDEINTLRGTIWINGKFNLLKERLIFNYETYFQPSLQKANNFRYQGNISVEMPIIKYLNFKVNYLRTFESIVIEGQKQEDRFLTFGFTVKNF